MRAWEETEERKLSLKVKLNLNLNLHLPHSRTGEKESVTRLLVQQVVVLWWSVPQSYLTLWDPMTVAHLVPLTMGFPRQEYWSGLPIPPSEDLPDSWIEPTSLAYPALAGRFFITVPLGMPGRGASLKKGRYHQEALQFFRYNVWHKIKITRHANRQN